MLSTMSMLGMFSAEKSMSSIPKLTGLLEEENQCHFVTTVQKKIELKL